MDAVRQQLRAIDVTLPLSDVTTLDDQIAESLSSERILATLGSSFGVLALLLAAVGVYGVLAFAVARGPARLASGWRSVRNRATCHG